MKDIKNQVLKESGLTFEEWCEKCIDLQEAIMQDVYQGKISKESYLLDYIFHSNDNEQVLELLNEEVHISALYLEEETE